MNADSLREKHGDSSPVEACPVVIERVTCWQHQSDDGLFDAEPPQFGVDARKHRFTGTSADDDHQFRREIANQLQDVYAYGPCDRSQHDYDKKQAANIELRDQFAQGDQRGWPEFTDRERNGSEGADGCNPHHEADHLEQHLRDRMDTVDERLALRA